MKDEVGLCELCARVKPEGRALWRPDGAGMNSAAELHMEMTNDEVRLMSFVSGRNS